MDNPKKPYSPYNRNRQKIEKAKQKLGQAKTALALTEKEVEAKGLQLPRSDSKNPATLLDRKEIQTARNKGGRPKLDRALALEKGVKTLAKESQRILDTLVAAANDPDHPNHWEAVKLLAERILPAGLYKAIGEAMVNGEKQGSGGVTITINSTAPTIHLGEAKPAEVPLLPEYIDVEAEEVNE